MIIGVIVLAAAFGLCCAIASLLMGYGLLVAFCCYVGGGVLAFCMILFYHHRLKPVTRAPEGRPSNLKQSRS
jgi:hypothetical protein